MRIIQLLDIEKKESPLHYQRRYTALAELELTGALMARKRIDFSLEHTPLGAVDVSISLPESPDYPLVPVLRALKGHIGELDQRGELP